MTSFSPILTENAFASTPAGTLVFALVLLCIRKTNGSLSEQHKQFVHMSYCSSVDFSSHPNLFYKATAGFHCVVTGQNPLYPVKLQNNYLNGTSGKSKNEKPGIKEEKKTLLS